MTCSICEISTVCSQRSGKVRISDVSDANKSKIAIQF